MGSSTPDPIASAKPVSIDARQLEPECESAASTHIVAVTGNGAPYTREMQSGWSGACI